MKEMLLGEVRIQVNRTPDARAVAARAESITGIGRSNPIEFEAPQGERSRKSDRFVELRLAVVTEVVEIRARSPRLGHHRGGASGELSETERRRSGGAAFSSMHLARMLPVVGFFPALRPSCSR